MNEKEVEKRLAEVRSKGIGPETMMSTFEAAQVLRVSPSTIKRWADTGAIAFHRTTGGHRRFRLSDVAAFKLPASSRKQMRLPYMN